MTSHPDPITRAKHGILKMLSVSDKESLSWTELRKLDYNKCERALFLGCQVEGAHVKILNPFKGELSQALTALEQENYIEAIPVTATPHNSGKKYKITVAGREHLEIMDKDFPIDLEPPVALANVRMVLAAHLGADNPAIAKILKDLGPPAKQERNPC